ncbi:MAG: EAL domain-containing protein, partial [Verrucomicrobiae bacterium]|nr:EAL domain-containing protein [Verrucomicrobiae bacterium]
AIADLAHAIGIHCVAEYVECEDSLERLRGIGVDYAQGYHLGAPKSYPFDEADPELRPRRYVAHGSVILPG